MVDYAWGSIPVSLWLLIGGYYLRRDTVPRRSRYRILLILNGMCVLMYVGAFWGEFDKYHTLVFVVLVGILAVTSVVLYRYFSPPPAE